MRLIRHMPLLAVAVVATLLLIALALFSGKVPELLVLRKDLILVLILLYLGRLTRLL